MKAEAATLLAEHPFLKGLSAEHFESLADCASHVRFAHGDYLLRELEAARLQLLGLVDSGADGGGQAAAM